MLGACLLSYSHTAAYMGLELFILSIWVRLCEVDCNLSYMYLYKYICMYTNISFKLRQYSCNHKSQH